MIIFATIILFASSILWESLFQLQNKPAYLLAIYLISVTNIILTEYIGDLFFLLDSPLLFLTIEH